MVGCVGYVRMNKECEKTKSCSILKVVTVSEGFSYLLSAFI